LGSYTLVEYADLFHFLAAVVLDFLFYRASREQDMLLAWGLATRAVNTPEAL